MPFIDSQTTTFERAFALLQPQHATLKMVQHDVLVYELLDSGGLLLDHLPFVPIFAQNAIQQATHAHFEMTCPYCEKTAPFVGGNTHDGYYFICEDRCHTPFTRFIRRY